MAKIFLGKFIFIICIGILSTIIFTWPFVTKLTSFYTDYGDYPLNGSILWYNQDSIKTGRIFNQENYFNGFEFYPQPYTLAYSDHRLIPSLVFTPIYWITNNLIFSVNSVTFLTFVFSFLTSFYVIKFFTKNYYASIIGAIIYSFNPLTFARFPLHLDLLNKYFLPLIFLYSYKYLTIPNLKNAFLFFLFFTLNSLSAAYFQIFTIIALPIFSLPFLIKNLKSLSQFLKYITNLAKYFPFFLFFIPVLIYFNLPYLQFSQKENVHRTIEGNIFFSARLIDYFSPSQDSFLYGKISNFLEPYRSPKDPNSGYFNHEEHALFLNILPMILFLISIICIFKRSKNNNSKFVLSPFILLLFFTFMFTFGPFFQYWNNFASADLTLPYYFLYKYFPFFNGIRSPSRFQFLFYIPFSLIASYGFIFIFEKLNNSKLKKIIFVIFLLVLFIENYNLKTYDEKSVILQKLDNINLKGNPLKFLEGKNTLHLPINIPDFGKESTYSNWLTVTKEKIMNGNTGYLPQDQTNLLLKIKGKLDENTLKNLIALKVNYIVIHQDLLDKNDKTNLEFNNLYKQGEVYQTNGIRILDLRKYNYQIKECGFDKDFYKKLEVTSLKNYNQTFYVLLLKNMSNCYLSNSYNNKYKTISFNTNDFYGNAVKRTAYLRLPILIEPFEEVLLSEVNGDLKIE